MVRHGVYDMSIKQNQIHLIAFLCIIASLLPWAITQFTNAINTDIAFLTLSAKRMLQGLSMSEGYFDTNPPLSIIVQTPAVLLSKLGIQLHHATNIYFIFLLGLSTAASAALLKRIPNLTAANRYIILSCFLVTATLKTGYDFGQKDHILALALFPLVLLQILITKKITINAALFWLILVTGSSLILLKPHYGLIPAAIFIHRIITQKRINIFLDKDFLALATAALTYIGTIFILFPDFINVILPDILKYYASDISLSVIESVIILMVIAAIPLIIYTLFLNKEHTLIPVFSSVAVLCLIPVLLQGKGWAYHAIPSNIFMVCAYGMLINTSISKVSNIQILGFLFTIVLLLVMIFQDTTKPSAIKTHEQLQSSQLAQILKNCEQPCSFLMLHDMINIPHELSMYTDRAHASRFPIMWFIPHFINPENKVGLTEQQKYTNMVVEDFTRWQPTIIFVAHFPYPSREGEMFNYRDYFIQTEPKFNAIWAGYNLEKSINVDRIDYMERKKPNEDLIRYDIYRKKTEQ